MPESAPSPVSAPPSPVVVDGRLRLRGPSPIIVGVTGHRDLRDEDIAGLAAAIDRFFSDFSSRYPDSDLLVISGLADGADRLVASRAFELGHPVIALLPMPAADYEKDFTAPGSLEDFRASLARCVRTIELPWLVGEESREEDDAGSRRAQYVLLGDELVANSAVVLALWNGQVTGLPGGTDTVVSHARLGRAVRALSAFDVPATFVYHIVTPRRSYADTIGEPLSHTSFENQEKNTCLESLHQQNTWNRDAAAMWATSRLVYPVDTGSEVVKRTFDIADSLAISEQVQEQRAFLSVYLIGAVAALLFGAYSTLFVDADWLLAIDIALTASGFIAYAVAASRKAPDRFQDYRALAEGLRVQAAWAEAGLRADVADHYTNRQRGELDWEPDGEVDEPTGKLNWVRRTIRVSRQLHDFGTASDRDRRDHRTKMQAVDATWIAPQASYFGRAAAKKAKIARRCRIAYRTMAVGALATTIVLLLSVEIPPFHDFGDNVLKGPLLFVIGMLGIGAALVQSYSDKRALGALSKRYAVMQRTFATATKVVGEHLAGDYGEFDEGLARHVILELGKEALAENADWMIAMRDRPLESVLSV